MIVGLKDKDRELAIEVEDLKKQVTEMETQVTDLSASLAKELSEKVKTRCIVVQS